MAQEMVSTGFWHARIGSNQELTIRPGARLKVTNILIADKVVESVTRTSLLFGTLVEGNTKATYLTVASVLPSVLERINFTLSLDDGYAYSFTTEGDSTLQLYGMFENDDSDTLPQPTRQEIRLKQPVVQVKQEELEGILKQSSEESRHAKGKGKKGKGKAVARNFTETDLESVGDPEEEGDLDDYEDESSGQDDH